MFQVPRAASVQHTACKVALIASTRDFMVAIGTGPAVTTRMPVCSPILRCMCNSCGWRSCNSKGAGEHLRDGYVVAFE